MVSPHGPPFSKIVESTSDGIDGPSIVTHIGHGGMADDWGSTTNAHKTNADWCQSAPGRVAAPLILSWESGAGMHYTVCLAIAEKHNHNNLYIPNMGKLAYQDIPNGHTKTVGHQGILNMNLFQFFSSIRPFLLSFLKDAYICMDRSPICRTTWRCYLLSLLYMV